MLGVSAAAHSQVPFGYRYIFPYDKLPDFYHKPTSTKRDVMVMDPYMAVQHLFGRASIEGFHISLAAMVGDTLVIQGPNSQDELLRKGLRMQGFKVKKRDRKTNIGAERLLQGKL